jgi:hypothetical protein
VVEQLFRKQQVVSSILTVGSRNNNMSRNSRLRRKLERKTKKNLFLGVIGIGIILFVLIRFGVPALANFTLFLSGIKNTDNSPTKSEATFIPPPILESQFTATNSSSLIINGRAIKKYKINIYVNNEKQETLDSQNNGIFSTKITLIDGNNSVKAESYDNNGKKSSFSNIISVNYIKSAPMLTISSPADGDSFSKDQNKANVSGKTDAGVTVTVNNFWAIIDVSNTFTYELPLKNGENQINIVATDQAGNKTEKTIKVNYSQ